MKKKYVKPYLALESFQLVAALAGACGGDGQIALNQSVTKCEAWEEYDDPLFGDMCMRNVFDIYKNDITSDGICYHGPIDSGLYLTS